MSSIAAKREYVSRQYGGTWARKVEAMPDNQVLAIYFKMIKEEPQKCLDPVIESDYLNKDGLQLSFFENDFSTKIKEAFLNECCNTAVSSSH